MKIKTFVLANLLLLLTSCEAQEKQKDKTEVKNNQTVNSTFDLFNLM